MIGAFLLDVLTGAVLDAATSSREYRQEMRAYLEQRGLTPPAPSRKSPDE